MSLTLRALREADKRKNLTRTQILALLAAKAYDDGRTKQCHKNECDIVKIMARFATTQTISHLAKYEGVYADFSDFDFHKQSTLLAQGETIFANLNAELRREFNQNPAEFFAYVNDPKNSKDLQNKLPGLAAPGDQLPAEEKSADFEARIAALEKPEESSDSAEEE